MSSKNPLPRYYTHTLPLVKLILIAVAIFLSSWAVISHEKDYSGVLVIISTIAWVSWLSISGLPTRPNEY